MYVLKSLRPNNLRRRSRAIICTRNGLGNIYGNIYWKYIWAGHHWSHKCCDKLVFMELLTCSADTCIQDKPFKSYICMRRVTQEFAFYGIKNTLTWQSFKGLLLTHLKWDPHTTDIWRKTGKMDHNGFQCESWSCSTKI